MIKTYNIRHLPYVDGTSEDPIPYRLRIPKKWKKKKKKSVAASKSAPASAVVQQRSASNFVSKSHDGDDIMMYDSEEDTWVTVRA